MIAMTDSGQSLRNLYVTSDISLFYLVYEWSHWFVHLSFCFVEFWCFDSYRRLIVNSFKKADPVNLVFLTAHSSANAFVTVHELFCVLSKYQSEAVYSTPRMFSSAVSISGKLKRKPEFFSLAASILREARSIASLSGPSAVLSLLSTTLWSERNVKNPYLAVIAATIS